MTSRPVAVCNMANHSSVWVAGARAYVMQFGGDGKSRYLLIRSRSGRHIMAWVKDKEITNLRTTTLHEGDPRFADNRVRTRESF